MVKLFVRITLFLLFLNHANANEIDICEDNYACKKTYNYNYLSFDFQKGIVKHRYKFNKELQEKWQSFYEINREFRIISVDNDGIVFDQTFQDYFKNQHKMYLDDKYLIGSDYYKSNYEKKINESGGIEGPWYRVKIFPEKNIIEEIYWPLTKDPKKNIINLVMTEQEFKNEEQKQQIAKMIVFVASVYLYSKAIDKAKNLKTTNQNLKNPDPQSGGGQDFVYSPLTPTWALPPAQRAERVGKYLMGLRLFP